MSNVDEFRQAYDLSESLWDRYRPEGDALQAEFEVEMRAHWKKACPRRPFSLNKAMKEVPHSDLIREPYQKRANEIVKRRDAERKELNQKLSDLARDIEITGDLLIDDVGHQGWSFYDASYSSTYSSQGFGAVKYAKESAESKLAHVKHAGVRAEIRRVDHDPFIASGWTMESADFKIFAACTPLACEIIRLKDGPSLRETVKALLLGGANPRVMYPMLPHGYEASVGLDYFGREVKKSCAAEGAK